MGAIRVSQLGKAYKQYPTKWARLLEWLTPFRGPRHALKWVLRDIDFEIAPGEAVGIVGVNGAGKSTLLKLITGTTAASTGRVDVRGRVAALLELGMGFHPDFSGRQNVLMAGQLIGLEAAQITALMPHIEQFAEIGDYIDQPVRVYSSGMQVRLAFSVATAVRPDILIVDEALAVGDVFFQQKCYERIRAFCQAGTTLLFVSHAMGTMYSLCNRALLISEGTIALDSSPREVIDLYNAHVLQLQGGKPTGGEAAPAPAAPAPAPAAASAAPAAAAPGAPATVGSFGQAGAHIASVGLYADEQLVGAIVSDHCANVRVQVGFARAFADPHIGFQIRNARGEAVFMTNTYCMRHSIGAVRENDEVMAEFSFKASLAPGDYTITAGVAEGGAGEGEFRQTLARTQDGFAFTVLRNVDAIVWSGLCNLDPVCELHRRAAAAAA
jgi:lipopolysaccharide transport system ATP-binding protein